MKNFDHRQLFCLRKHGTRKQWIIDIIGCAIAAIAAYLLLKL
jgi:hypothetical protein